MKTIVRLGSQCLWILLPMLLSGCQGGGRSLLPDKQGYYTWIDASGQLRTTLIERSGETAPDPAATQPGPSGTGVAPEQTLPGKNQSAGRDDDGSEYTLANYPDANALEKSGYLRPGDPLPYFTWQDASGRIRVTYYRPDTRSDVAKGLVPQPIELSDASVYTVDSGRTLVNAQPWVDARVPEAFRVLGIDPDGESLFQQWRALCCKDLTVGQVLDWSADREFQLDLDATSPTHRFSTGVSHFRLVQLPATSPAGGFVLRLRSFSDHGVFVPSLAFLDQDLEPVRLVTDLVMPFRPESWHRQGYLEAFVPVFPARGERWLMVFTRAEDLASQTVTETRHGPRRISHEPTGTLSLTGMTP